MKRDDDLESIVQQAFLDAFPNPERLGCPGRTSLEAMLEARDQSSVDVWQHVNHCSPCAREILQIRSARKRRRWIWLGLGAAALLIISFSTLFFRASRAGIPFQPAPHTDRESIAELDFRKTSEVRGIDSPRPAATNLPRGTQRLVILLPPSSDQGSYEFDLRAASNMDQLVFGPVTGSASTTADGTTKLTVRVDLKALPAGHYIAAWHRSSSTLNFSGPLDLVP